ncbi:MAG: hypothetical protein ACTSPV_12970 [Candidatus Hodarchaeales archaeon]
MILIQLFLICIAMGLLWGQMSSRQWIWLFVWLVTLTLLFLKVSNEEFFIIFLYIDLIFFIGWSVLGAYSWSNRKFTYQICTSNAAIISFIACIIRAFKIISTRDFAGRLLENIWKVVFYLAGLPITILVFLVIILGLAIYSQYTIQYEESKILYYFYSVTWILGYIALGLILSENIVKSTLLFTQEIIPTFFPSDLLTLGLILIIAIGFIGLELLRPLLFWTLKIPREEYLNIIDKTSPETIENQ